MYDSRHLLGVRLAATILHLVAVERLAREPGELPEEIAQALAEDLEYARFGAALPDLPYFGRFPRILAERGSNVSVPMPPFARLLHGAAPVAVGLKLAELVSRGALVGREPGLAVTTGYFLHVALDRALRPLEEELLGRLRAPGESPNAASRRIEWEQALLYLRETHGFDLVGTEAFSLRCRIVKRQGLPIRGIGRGLYELVRAACAEVLGPAPRKAEIDGWVRGLFLFGKVLGSPLGRRFAPKQLPEELVRGEGYELSAIVDRALAQVRLHVGRLHALILHNDFSPRARGRFVSELPEGSLLGDE